MANSIEYIYKNLCISIYDDEPLEKTLARRLDLPEIISVSIEHEAIDARRKPDVTYLYHLRFQVSNVTPKLKRLISTGQVSIYKPPALPPPERYLRLPERPIIVGFGPAGMFLGLELARLGYRPILFERGETVEKRLETIQTLWSGGVLNPDSNLQYGEGGAGTFSDGKLTTGKRKELAHFILKTLVEAGAPRQILYLNKPHIGTENLQLVVKNLRKEIESLGGQVYFNHKMTDLILDNGAVKAITIKGQTIQTSWLGLAIGHSSRDTISLLYHRGVAMEAKPFAVGVRIEHPASLINELQYGKTAAKKLPAADYRLTYHHKDTGVYSFCVCPGGKVVCAASEPDGLVVNGMSFFQRDEATTNGAIVVSVEPTRYGYRDPLDGISFQQHFEKLAYIAGGGSYIAPAQRAADFVANRPSTSLPETSYRPAVLPADLNNVLPPPIIPALKAGLLDFQRKLPGFIDEGILIGFESRTSSPIRILRNQDYVSNSTPGLYLFGEGAGYAGGIMTCAMDALRFCRLVKPWNE